MVETMSVLTQALALSGIALNYDQGFIVDYNTDVLSIALSNRTQIRDAALAKFDEAITLAAADSFTVPGGDWRSEEHTSELQSHSDLVCRLLLEKKKQR